MLDLRETQSHPALLSRGRRLQFRTRLACPPDVLSLLRLKVWVTRRGPRPLISGQTCQGIDYKLPLSCSMSVCRNGNPRHVYGSVPLVTCEAPSRQQGLMDRCGHVCRLAAFAVRCPATQIKAGKLGGGRETVTQGFRLLKNSIASRVEMTHGKWTDGVRALSTHTGTTCLTEVPWRFHGTRQGRSYTTTHVPSPLCDDERRRQCHGLLRGCQCDRFPSTESSCLTWQ